MGPNLGIIETTIAMHYVFNFPVDKVVLMFLTNVIRTKFLQEEKRVLQILIII